MRSQLIQNDCVAALPTLEACSVQAFITSPPYWGLRDYGVPPTSWPEVRYAPMAGLPEVVVPAMECCLGLEPTPEAFIGHLLHVFRLAAPALKADGTCWVNLGDTYSGSRCGGNTGVIQGKQSGRGRAESVAARKQVLDARTQSRRRDRTEVPRSDVQVGGLPAKNLVGIPWRFAFAMQADGWYLRQDIIWAKPNPMPESCTDRCTKAHEYLFLFSKSPRYYFNHVAIAEPLAASSVARLAQDLEQQNGSDRAYGGGAQPMKAVQARPQLLRALELAEKGGLTEAHLDAIRACGIADGKTLETQTGAGRNTEQVQQLAEEARQVLGSYYREFLAGRRSSGNAERKPRPEGPEDSGKNQCGHVPWEDETGLRNKRSVWTVATKPYSEAHFAVFPPELILPCILAGSRVGDLVCDMFSGSGTTGQEAIRLGRHYLGIEAKPANIGLHRKRIGGLQTVMPM
ncbi:DNA-methyltransferase [Hymenobacter sp. B81]|uniref:DNA-methyltransferase n=1 Tax=Hymenobacter sp. B81 TaxID=3344878 RepID=UPI0037DD1139